MKPLGAAFAAEHAQQFLRAVTGKHQPDDRGA